MSAAFGNCLRSAARPMSGPTCPPSISSLRSLTSLTRPTCSAAPAARLRPWRHRPTRSASRWRPLTLTLTSNLAGAAVQEASLRGQIAATQSIIKIERDILDLLRRQRGLGAVADADVVAQEAALAQAEQALPPLRKQLAQQRNLLAALTGGFPSQQLPQQFVLSELRLPRDLPVSLPSQLVEQRPDIRAAEANLQAASAQIGVTIANRLPNITLATTAGSTALAVDQLFTPGTGFWSVAGAAAQPIFHGGTLLHRELAAKAAYDQAAAQYRSTVITAFQNVADLLRAI